MGITGRQDFTKATPQASPPGLHHTVGSRWSYKRIAEMGILWLLVGISLNISIPVRKIKQSIRKGEYDAKLREVSNG